ncbi:hypothetical protein BASA81_015568 [Batrachochytrium salamandrivorans]|nr:hypothetical protein BASA81_015568 [Batrachochytrium salamandrivorans]
MGEQPYQFQEEIEPCMVVVLNGQRNPELQSTTANLNLPNFTLEFARISSGICHTTANTETTQRHQKQQPPTCSMAGDKKPASWDETQRWTLVHCALNQLKVGERLEGSFKAAEWDRIAEDFTAITRKTYIKQQLQTQLAILKRAYKVVHALRVSPSFVWQDDLPCAPADVVAAYLADHPEATPYMTVPFPLYDDLHQLLHKKLPSSGLLAVDMDNQRLVVAAAAAAACSEMHTAQQQQQQQHSLQHLIPGPVHADDASRGDHPRRNSLIADHQENGTNDNDDDDDDDVISMSDFINASPALALKSRILAGAAAAAGIIPTITSIPAVSSTGPTSVKRNTPYAQTTGSVWPSSKRAKTSAVASFLMDSLATLADTETHLSQKTHTST